MTRTFLAARAAGGRGGSIVEATLAAGCNVLVTDLDPGAPPPPPSIAAGCAPGLDVTDPVAARDAVAYAVAEFGAVDVLVNSAGIRDVGSVEGMPEEAFRRNAEVNFFGVVNTVRAVLPGAARVAEDTAWREVSASTDFDGLGDFADTAVARLVGPGRS